MATTPGRFRVASIAAAAALVMLAIVGTVAANNLRTRTERIRDNTGPVLVATQSLIASLAEADAAATAAFLSGADEDREQRRLYEQALARAATQLEEVSSRIGTDEDAHAALRELSVEITTYAGLVERARAENRVALPAADQSLIDAVNALARTVNEDAASLTKATQDRFDDDRDSRATGVVVAVGLAVLALVVLVLAQVDVFRRSRRVLNVPLVVATLLALVSALWLGTASNRSGNDLEAARAQGYESIALTADIQKQGFRAKSAETIALITDDDSKRRDADAAASSVGSLVDRANDAADSVREEAAVREMNGRFGTYREAVTSLRGLGPDAARAFAVGPASSAFTGFNVSVESVLGDNRAQFFEGLESAMERLDWIEWIVLLLPLAGAAAALLGFQLRINEYR